MTPSLRHPHEYPRFRRGQSPRHHRRHAGVENSCQEAGFKSRRLAPVDRQSGQWKGKSFIQGGTSWARQALYMPALVVLRFNQPLKAKYRGLRTGGQTRKADYSRHHEKPCSRKRARQGRPKIVAIPFLTKTDT
ncbi:transposase [Mesorhizobium sp. M0983]|uniref:transposase n=1 Tax=Mesorhizobium sp. M0983 TaxID=2957040 RepID=UPI003335BA95